MTNKNKRKEPFVLACSVWEAEHSRISEVHKDNKKNVSRDTIDLQDFGLRELIGEDSFREEFAEDEDFKPQWTGSQSSGWVEVDHQPDDAPEEETERSSSNTTTFLLLILAVILVGYAAYIHLNIGDLGGNLLQTKESHVDRGLELASQLELEGYKLGEDGQLTIKIKNNNAIPIGSVQFMLIKDGQIVNKEDQGGDYFAGEGYLPEGGIGYLQTNIGKSSKGDKKKDKGEYEIIIVNGYEYQSENE